MEKLNLNQPQKIYFIGIGGISMSGLAELLLSKGFSVSGSDSKQSDLTDALCAKGAKIYYDQSVSHIPEDTELVVYTAAIRPDNAELVDAKNKGIKTITRAELLGQIMLSYNCSIAISGTHGKTTTTSMVSEILLKANMDPTISIGGILPSINNNFRVGKDNGCFVAEACEYTNSFLSFYPNIAIILNIDADHLDFFKDLDDIRNSFNLFAKQINPNGYLIINGDIPDVDSFISNLNCHIIKVGSDSSNDYYAQNIVYSDEGCARFDSVCVSGSRHFELSVPGLHNVYNSLAAIAIADILNVDYEDSFDALSSFSNSKRRFEFKGILNGINIYDDYAHHPTEISATLTTAKKVNHKDIWVIFQPHTYTRTKALMDDFAAALSNADHVILADIYAAREKDNLGISSETLKEKIAQLGTDCYYFSTFDEIKNFVLQNCTNNDLLITMGAGDIVKISDELTSTT